jgi:hypothetical protein
LPQIFYFSLHFVVAVDRAGRHSSWCIFNNTDGL